MKSMIRVMTLFFLALVLGVILAPRVYSVAHQTGYSFQGQVNSIILEMQGTAQNISPTAAALAPAILAGAGALAAALFVYLLLFVPYRIYALQRQIRRQGEQIDSLRREIYLSSDLFIDARRNNKAQIENERAHADAKSDLRQFIFPGLH